MSTKITNNVLESYLHCKFKGYLKVIGQQGTECDFEAMLMELRAEVRLKAIATITSCHPEDKVAWNIPLTTANLKLGPQYVLEGTLEDSDVSVRFDGLKKVEGKSKLGDFHYQPVLFHWGRQIKKEQKLLLEVYGLILTGLQGRAPAYGVVWHGRDCKATGVMLNLDQRKAEQVLRGLRDMTTSSLPQRLLLNDHCQVCEFRQRCHEQAVKEDNITLLRKMGEKEVNRYARKGISTVTQLSCTFRMRKRGKRVKTQHRPRSFALQALALREKKIYVVGTPVLPTAPVCLYFDCEGDPEKEFVYLIGLTMVGGGEERHYSFWADNEKEESFIFKQFLDTVSQYVGSTLFHYGSYERVFLHRMRKAAMGKKLVERLLANSCNIVAVIHGNIYFPTYSNGLKDVGAYLGCTWSEGKASGAQSVAWRRMWELGGGDVVKQKLIIYNTEDCAALRRVTESIAEIIKGMGEGGSQAGNITGPLKVDRAENIPASTAQREFGRGNFASPELDYVNQCAYFDYQRDKVFLRTNKTLRRVHAHKGERRAKKLKVNRRIVIRSLCCPFCKGRSIRRYPNKRHVKLAYDLRITQGGIQRQVIECTTALHRCLDCSRVFLPQRYKRRDKHFHALKSWAMYQHIAHRVSFQRIEEMIWEFFGLRVTYVELHMFKSLLGRRYQPTVRRIQAKLIAGAVIHADETSTNLQKAKGYVWVLANMEEVIYLFKPTREGDFLHDLLKNFTGVLITDFYSAYDSLPCEQQKCLVHLIRDMNHDLLSNPFDSEFKSLVSEFGMLLRTIVATIDQYGLKKRHLHKHTENVERFFRTLGSRQFHSDLAQAYQLRLTKNREKLFTFLRYDSVPWNNNNAEHAFKHYARYREVTDGKMTESGINDYLVLLSVYQTCKYKGVSFLKFLLSGEKDVDKFIESRGKKRLATGLELYPKDFNSNHPRRGRLKPKPSQDDASQAPESPLGKQDCKMPTES
jgi:predicted RecB family nuclease